MHKPECMASWFSETLILINYLILINCSYFHSWQQWVWTCEFQTSVFVSSDFAFRPDYGEKSDLLELQSLNSKCALISSAHSMILLFSNREWLAYWRVMPFKILICNVPSSFVKSACAYKTSFVQNCTRSHLYLERHVCNMCKSIFGKNICVRSKFSCVRSKFSCVRSSHNLCARTQA